MNSMNVARRKARIRLRRRVRHLALTSFKDSIAPRMAIASELAGELSHAGIPKEDHLIVVMNMFPEGVL